MSDTDAAADTMPYLAAADLTTIRAFVRARAMALGLPASRADLLMLAVSELATNTLQHTGGGGRVRLWADDGQLVCDVLDSGDGIPVMTRGMPPPDSIRGRGLAIVERVADHVTASTDPSGTLVRLRLNL